MVRLVGVVLLFLLFFFCPGPDRTPPSLRLVFPAAGDTVSDTVTVIAHATDDRRVARVEFFVDDSLIGLGRWRADSVFELDWDVTGYPPGSRHHLFAVALDRAGNSDSSAPVEVVTFPQSGTHHQGRIISDETWSASGNPHYIDGNLEVDAVLTVEPGVVIKVAPDVRITVGVYARGGVRIQGSSDAPVRISAAVAGARWQGFYFRQRAQECRFSYCVIEGGGAAGALFRSEGARLSLTNCSLKNSAGDGVVLAGGDFVQFENNFITGCAGFPLVVDAAGAGSIGTGNRFFGNGQNFIKVTGGDIVTAAVWINSGVPYYVGGSISIAGESLPVLTLAPGCSLLFADSAKIRVGVGMPGGMVADGSYGPIVFTGYSGHWHGLEFWSGTLTQTLLKNCVIDRAGGGGLAAVITYVPLRVTGSVVKNSASAGIYCIGCGFTQFEFNTISGCAGFPLHIEAPYVASLGQGNNLGANGQNFVDVVGGTITQDGQWVDQGVPYRVNGMLEVGSVFAPMFAIGSGVTLQFAANSGLRVGDVGLAKLMAVGMPDSVVFCGDTARAGAWRGIEFGSFTSGATVVDRCRVVYAGGGGVLAAITVRNCNPTIRNSEVGYSARYCIALINSSLDPDSLRRNNWLHDWGEEYDDIYDEGP